MCMFQILTQEGWTDIVVDIMRKTGQAGINQGPYDPTAPGRPSIALFVAIYFLSYHLFVTLVSLRSHRTFQ